MDITEREINNVNVVSFEGKLNTKTSPDAESFLSDLVGDGATKILLNFEELDFISSTGLRTILSTGKKLRKVKGEIRLCALNITITDIFKMSGFNKMFKIFDTEEEALSNF